MPNYYIAYQVYFACARKYQPSPHLDAVSRAARRIYELCSEYLTPNLMLGLIVDTISLYGELKNCFYCVKYQKSSFFFSDPAKSFFLTYMQPRFLCYASREVLLLGIGKVEHVRNLQVSQNSNCRTSSERVNISPRLCGVEPEGTKKVFECVTLTVRLLVSFRCLPFHLPFLRAEHDVEFCYWNVGYFEGLLE